MERVRFLINGAWTRYFTREEDFSFLYNNKDINAIETSETMTKDEFYKRFPEEKKNVSKS